MFRIGRAAAVTAVAGIAMAMLGAQPASAYDPQQTTDRNGVCDVGELCLWYRTNYGGSMIDILYNNSGRTPPWVYNDASYFNDFFITNGDGKGQGVLNNAASALNKDLHWPVRIYSDKFCKGSYIEILPMHSHPDLGSIRNNNESHCWVT